MKFLPILSLCVLAGGELRKASQLLEEPVYKDESVEMEEGSAEETVELPRGPVTSTPLPILKRTKLFPEPALPAPKIQTSTPVPVASQAVPTTPAPVTESARTTTNTPEAVASTTTERPMEEKPVDIPAVYSGPDPVSPRYPFWEVELSKWSARCSLLQAT